MNYDEFINRWLGQAIDWDKMYGAQCVDEIAQYCTENNMPVAYANAKDWANHPALLGAFDWITNNPTDYNQVPKRGDIIVWGGGLPGSGGYGHIAIWDMVTGPGKFQSLDQNWGGQYVHFVPNHTWDYILGWLSPKRQVDPTPTPPPPPPTPIPAPDPHPDPAPENPIPPTPVTTPPQVDPAPIPTPPVVETPPDYSGLLKLLKAIFEFFANLNPWKKL